MTSGRVCDTGDHSFLTANLSRNKSIQLTYITTELERNLFTQVIKGGKFDFSHFTELKNINITLKFT